MDFGPGAAKDGLCQRGGEDGGDDISLRDINTKAGSVTKKVDQAHRLPEQEILLGRNGEVVGAGPGFNPRNSINAAEENIITDDKEDRGEGTALLDPSTNVNPDIRGAPESGADLNRVEQASNQPLEPLWQSSPSDRLKNK